jgi:thiol-disulfide isomerase/thioredoxin
VTTGRAAWPLLAAVLMVLSGCAGDASLPQPDLASHVDVDNAELRAAKADIGVLPCPRPGHATSDLPAVSLPCLGGGREVTLRDIQGPAVVSLWASWCTSCPDELPLYQRLSKEAAGRLSVMGVDYQDTQPGKAMALLDLTGAVFPQVADPGGELADEFRLTGLPGILLVDRDGEVTFLLRRIDTYADLVRLVRDHTGVDVGAG